MIKPLCAIDAVIELQKPEHEQLEQYFRIESVDFKHTVLCGIRAI